MRRLFVISDLHLGGRPDKVDSQGKITSTGFQICHAHKELVDFIYWVKTRREGLDPEDIELVVNGDIVDYLADDDLGDPSVGAQVWTADQGQAVQKLDRIVQRARDASGRGVFESLKDFLAAGHRLTILLGNHDVELSLPAVRQRLTQLLGGDAERLKFIYDGEAYVVGGVLIEHGNRYDRWNQINYSTLRQERSMCSRRLPVREEHRKDRYFVVPAGSYIVIHFLNRIKRRYRFVDLLKPETNAVLPLLVALEPSYRPLLEDILEVGPVAKRLWKSGLQEPTLPRVAGDLANWSREGPGKADLVADEGDRPGSPGGQNEEGPGGDLVHSEGARTTGVFHDPFPVVIGQVDLLENFLPEGTVSLDGVLAETLGNDAELFVHKREPGEDLSLVGRAKDALTWLTRKLEQLEETSDSLTQVLKRAGEDYRMRQLHAALRCLNCNDRSFDPGQELPEYLEAARETAEAGKFEVVTYGHTHLPKKVGLGRDGNGPPWYVNTGTWCDVMRLPDEIAADYQTAGPALREFVTAIRGNDFKTYVRRYLTFLEIDVDPTKTEQTVSKVELHSFCGTGLEASKPLTSVLNAQKGTSG